MSPYLVPRFGLATMGGLALGMGLLLSGCSTGRSSSESAGSHNETAAAKDDESSPALADTAKPERSAGIAPTGQGQAETGLLPASSLPESPADPTRRRMLLLAQQPWLLELQLRASQQPLEAVWRASATRVLASVDANTDGKTDWEELLGSELAGGMPSLENSDAAQRRMIISAYDVSNDDLVDADELVKFLNRDAGAQAHLTLLTRNAENESTPGTGTLFRWLDQNANGRLDPPEIAAASDRLQEKDADGDRILWLTDFQSPTGPGLDSQESTIYATTHDTKAFHIDNDTDWSRLLYAMQEAYSYGDPLLPEDFPNSGACAELDLDKDDFITPGELAALQHRPVDVVVRLDFRDAAVSLNVEATDESPLQLADLEQPAKDGTTAKLLAGRNSLVLRAAPTPDSDFERMRLFAEYTPQQRGLQAALDTDGDGRLVARELADATARLQEYDANGDGQITPDELTRQNVLLFRLGRRNERRLAANRERPQRGSTKNNLPRWFAAMDVNGDGDVDRGEFIGSDNSFAELDANGDGFISRLETRQVPVENTNAFRPGPQERSAADGT